MAEALWFFYALGAAILWGLSYVLSEKVFDAGVSVPTFMMAYTATAAPFFLVLGLHKKSIKPSLEVLQNNKTVLLFLLLVIACYITSNFLVFKSLMMKNATLTSLVEISYPVFTILFSWLLFRDFHLNISTFCGALMIVGGVILIYLKG